MANPRCAADLAGLLKPSGLEPRGWLKPEPEEAPFLASGKKAALICLIGHAGGAFWPVFEAWRKLNPDVGDPLDNWSETVIGPIADALGAEAVFPSDRPWHPFQQWAMAAEGLKPSPLGLLIHPDYGLWHGYRGALLFDDGGLAEARLAAGSAVKEAARHPCDACTDRPCLSACPVDAFAPAGFAVSDCRGYLKLDTGQQGCMTSGCLARDACPVGRTYRYGAEQIRFHMAAYS